MTVATLGRISGLDASVQALFTPAQPPATGPGRVGIEYERFPLRTRNGAYEAVHIEEVEHLLARDPSLAADAGVSFEPGGQLEISPPPAASPRILLHSVQSLLERIDACLAPAGVRLEATGVNRRLTCDEIGLQKRTERYTKMQAHFDNIGPDGRRMMRQTASLQVCIDLLPGQAGVEQWQVLNLGGPALAAALNDSPAEQWGESRSLIWLGVDPGRTGFDGQHVLGDPVAGYLRLAERAHVIPMHNPDAAFHLSTLFPPVRPRGGYLEVRYLDSRPWPRVAEAISLLTTLAYEPNTRRKALQILPDSPTVLADLWQRNGRLGLRDRAVARLAQRSAGHYSRG